MYKIPKSIRSKVNELMLSKWNFIIAMPAYQSLVGIPTKINENPAAFHINPQRIRKKQLMINTLDEPLIEYQSK